MKHTITILLIGLTLLLSIRCLDPYKPRETSLSVNYLVVDGFINASDSSCEINLSRTIPLDTSTTVPAEKNAHVVVADDEGNTFPLYEITPGAYKVTGIVVNPLRKYQVNITTSDNQSYSSDLVPVVTTPPIDSVNWKLSGSQVTVFVNTHNPTADAGYYRWMFSETWAYHSAFRSNLLVNPDLSVVIRTDDIYDCYGSDTPSDIKIASTARLSQNTVSEFPLISIDVTSIKLQTRYCIQVQQRALTEEFYNYALLLKNTTENLGTLFDPLPTTIIGNIHNLTNPSNIAVGYFSAGTVAKQNLFITRKQVDPESKILVSTPYSSCKIDTVLLADASRLKYESPFNYLFLGDTTIIIGYFCSTPECVDCRLMGGTNIVPSFW